MENKNDAVSLKLDFTYEDEKHPALQDIEGCVSHGKCVVLCGGSGCGKTTLLRCLNQLIPQFYEGELKGFCRINGQDLNTLSIGQVGQLAASVFQDPRSQFFTLNSSTEIAFGLENFGVSQEKIEEKVKEAFSTFHLEHLKDRDVFSLSSGERQLIAILAAWVLDTDLFLLDEPTANLDFHTIDALSSLLRQVKDQGKTLIISEHRLYYLRDLADEYWLMEGGRIKKKYTRDEMLHLSSSERESLGLRATTLDSLENMPGKIVDDKGPEFTVSHLNFSYTKNSRKVLNDLSLKAYGREVIGLIGQNGCGKTSFGKLACGLLPANSGTFTYDGQPLTQKDLKEKSIFIMQEAEFQFFTNSVINELCYGRQVSKDEKEKIKELLHLVGLWECRNRHPFSLSGGQMQKLVLLLAYLSPKPIVVLDEPTAGLDYQSLVICSELIKKMQLSKTVFIITHDPELIARVCTKCLGIRKGSVEKIFDLTNGSLDEVLNFLKTEAADSSTHIAKEQPQKPGIDPRAKLCIFLLAMIAGIGTDSALIGLTFLPVLLVFLYERRPKPLVSGVILMGITQFLYLWIPNVATAFLASFFPRMVLICYAAFILASRKDASRSIAALRKLHVPEKLIMIVSVALRFFPVLQKDLKLMQQSIRTRGFFPGLKDKLNAVPEYLEILVVPMVFRVIRIAEALSASAETRGIALQTKRDSLIRLKIKGIDIFLMLLALSFFVAGLII